MALRHCAMVCPWKTTTEKNASRTRMRSGAMEHTSSSTGSGGPLNEYAISVGWIMTSEFRHVLAPQDHAVVRRLVRGVVEHLDELGPDAG